MRKFLITLLLTIFLVPAVAYGETTGEAKDTPVTKIENMLQAKGTVLVKMFYEMGKFSDKYGSSLTVTGVVVYIPGHESNKTRGIRVDFGSGGYDQKRSCYIDWEEMNSLIDSFDYLFDAAQKLIGQNVSRVEISFATQDDFRVGFYQIGHQQTAFSGNESAYVTLSSTGDLPRLKALFKDAYQKIKG